MNKRDRIIIRQVKNRTGLKLEKYDDKNFVLKEPFDYPNTYVFILEDEVLENGEIMPLNYAFHGFFNNQYRIIGIEPFAWDNNNQNTDADGSRELFTLDRDDIVETYYTDEETEETKRIIIFKTNDPTIKKSTSDFSDTFTIFTFMMLNGLDELVIPKSLSFDDDYQKYSDIESEFDEEFFKS